MPNNAAATTTRTGVIYTMVINYTGGHSEIYRDDITRQVVAHNWATQAAADFRVASVEVTGTDGSVANY